MIENFDDEKIASMESFSKMAQNYANMSERKNQPIKVLSDEDNVDLTDLALNVEEVGGMFKRLSNLSVNDDIKQFFLKLYDINEIELNDIVKLFELNNFKTHNPNRNFLKQNNIWAITRQILVLEAKNIKSMLETMDKKISKEKTKWLRNAILRRLDMIELILE